MITGIHFFNLKYSIYGPCLEQQHHSPCPSCAPEYLEVIFCWGLDGIDTQVVVYFFTYTILICYCRQEL
jgi:hypothetical protein